MKILSIVSRLLDYPTAELTAHSEEILSYIQSSEDLDHEGQQKLVTFVKHRMAGDVLDWQSEYDGLLMPREKTFGSTRDK